MPPVTVFPIDRFGWHGCCANTLISEINKSFHESLKKHLPIIIQKLKGDLIELTQPEETK